MTDYKYEKELNQKLNQNVTIPDTVNRRIDEVNEMILKQKNVTLHKKSHRKWAIAAASLGMMCVSSLGVLAATGFFSKDSAQTQEALEYNFDINYDLTSHKVQVTPGYLPENFQEWEQDKYSENGEWAKPGITIAAYTMANIDAMNSTLAITDGTLDEETTLNDLEAHVVLRKNDGINDAYNTVILFNADEGYVIEVMGSYQAVSVDELKKVADGLEIEVLPEEDDYLSEEEKGEDVFYNDFDGIIPQNHVMGLNQEVHLTLDYTDADNTPVSRDMSYTVKGVKILDSISGYPSENFYDYDELTPWLTETGTLKPYDRIVFSSDGSELERGSSDQKFIELTIRAQNHAEQSEELFAGYSLVQLKQNADGTYTIDETTTDAVAYDSYTLQDDQSPIYFDHPVFTEDEQRNHFFFRTLEPGEALEYKILYIVDADRTKDLALFLNYPGMALINDLDDAQLFVTLN